MRTWLHKRKSVLIAIAALLITIIFAVVGVHASTVKGSEDILPKGISSLNVSAFTRSNGYVLAGTSDGFVYCYLEGEDEPLWSYEKKPLSEDSPNPSTECLAVRDGVAYAAFGDKRIYSFDLEEGNIRCVYRVGAEPKKLAFNDEEKDLFAVYAETSGSKYVYLFPTDGEGTESEPLRVESGFSLNKNNGLNDGVSDLFLSSNGYLYYSTDISTVDRIAYSSEGFGEAEEIFTADVGLIAVSEGDDCFEVLDKEGGLYQLSLSGELIKKTSFSLTLTSAISSGDGSFVAKVKNGGIVGIEKEQKIFTLKTNKDALLLFYADDGFAFLSEDGGTLSYYQTEQAAKAADSNVLQTVCIVAGACFFALSLLFALASFPRIREAFIRFFKAFVHSIAAYWPCYLSLVPTFVLLIMFYYYPIIWGVGLSFFDYVPKEHAVFVGLDNIVSVIKNTAFWQSSLNMLWLLVTDILKALIPPFIFAECIIAVRSKKYSYWTRVLLFIPGILPGVASTLVWAEGIFGSGSSGLLNSALSALVPSFVNQSWLYQESTALGSIICFGFPWVGSYLLLYGAITGISPSLYEAAKLDGCTWLKRITHIDLPLILPQLKYIFITSFIASVQDYGRIYITTQGDYGTSTPALAMYLAITKEKNYGIASAMSLFLFAFLIVVTVINFRMQSDTSEEKTL